MTTKQFLFTPQHRANRNTRNRHQFFHHIPRVNVLKDGDNYQIEIAIPGLNKKDISLRIENGNLLINHVVEEKNPRTYLKKGFELAGFDRSFKLPKEVDTNLIQAEFTAGILSIKLPIKEAAKPKTISIN